jgi:TfoX/Sxy family transcriptional regulator of competence genes
MAYDTSLADRITDVFTARRVDFFTKRMFGGLCFMVHDKMCVGLTNKLLMVRLDPAIEAEALKRKGCRPMDFTGRPMKGYVFVEAEGTETDVELAAWLTMALEFNPKAKASKSKSKL